MLGVVFQTQISVWSGKAVAVRTHVAALCSHESGAAQVCESLAISKSLVIDVHVHIQNIPECGRGKDGTGVTLAAIPIKLVVLARF